MAKKKTETQKQKLKETFRETRERHSEMDVHVYTVKLDESHLSIDQYEHLKMLFVEARWETNDIIASNDIFNYDYRRTVVDGLDKNRNPVQRTLTRLSSQMRQSIVDRKKQDIINLAKVKEKTGKNVGRLKFKSHVDSIPLKQYGVTYRILNDKYIAIQGLRKPFKVRGLKQIPKGAEYVNAVLFNDCGNFYVKITCFVEKKQRQKTGVTEGLDYGIKTSVTISNGTKENICVSEPKRLRKLQRGLHRRQQKGSNRYNKTKLAIRKEYAKIKQQKEDLKNKFVSKVTKECDTIVMQDENVRGWHKGWFGKQVQHSCLGGITSALKKRAETLVIISRWYPSTKTCDECGYIQEVGLEERVVKCNKCGVVRDRDLRASLNIKQEGLEILGLLGNLGDPDKRLVEVWTSGKRVFLALSKSMPEKREAVTRSTTFLGGTTEAATL